MIFSDSSPNNLLSGEDKIKGLTPAVPDNILYI